MKKLVKNIFSSFDLKNKIHGFFPQNCRNQRLNIRGYSEFQMKKKEILIR